MTSAPFRSIARLLIERIIAMALLCMLVIAGGQAVVEYQRGHAQFDKDVRTLAEGSLPALSTGLWDIELIAVRRQVEWIASLRGVQYVQVRSAVGPAFEAGRSLQGGEQRAPAIVLPIKAPVGNSLVGELSIWEDEDAFRMEVLRRVLFMMGGYLLFTLLVCSMVAWVLRRELQVPLEQMRRFVMNLTPDQIAKPLVLTRRNPQFNDEIDVVVHGFQRLQETIQRHINLLDMRVAQRTEQLENLVQEVQRLSMLDSLTGCFNRRVLDERLPAEVERCHRYQRPLSVVFIDVDHFKRINDGLGHAGGDLVLQEIAKRCQASLRSRVDWVARYGGEEFVIVLPESDALAAQQFAERLRLSIRSQPIDAAGQSLSVTVSLGVAQLRPHESVQQLLARADALLYQAKQAGRDRVMQAPAEPSAAPDAHAADEPASS
jgi:two-component system cell cycle response regulator